MYFLGTIAVLVSINFLAVIVATIVSMVLGALWYSVFSKPWMSALGINLNDIEEARLSMTSAYIASTVCSLILAVSFAFLVSALNVRYIVVGVAMGAFVWVGFNFTSMLKLVFWEDRPWSLLFIDGGYDLINFMLVGGIVAGWR